MKAGARALGVAESYTGDESTLAGVVVRADGIVDGAALGSCTVGGLDATDAVIDLVGRVDRADVQYLLVAGIAPAWYNVLDLDRIHASADVPMISVSFEASEGLESGIRDAFEGTACDRRLDTYRRQPARDRVELDGGTVYARCVGLDDSEASDVVRGFTPSGGRPEPLRVARLFARAADRWRTVT